MPKVAYKGLVTQHMLSSQQPSEVCETESEWCPRLPQGHPKATQGHQKALWSKRNLNQELPGLSTTS